MRRRCRRFAIGFRLADWAMNLSSSISSLGRQPRRNGQLALLALNGFLSRFSSRAESAYSPYDSINSGAVSVCRRIVLLELPDEWHQSLLSAYSDRGR